MIEFGYTLQKAREDKGLTIQQIAERTHMLPQQVEDLEHENFSRIAAPIYGRGFVKLYCDAVGLEPKPLVDEFMEIYNGNRQPAIRTRPRSPQPIAEPPPPPADPVASEPERAADVVEEGEIEDQLHPEATLVPPVAHDAQVSIPVPSAEDTQEATIAAPAAAETSNVASAPGIVSAAPQERESFDAFKFEPPPPRFAQPQKPLPAGYSNLAGDASYTPAPSASRYASPVPAEPGRPAFGGFSIPPQVWRILLLAIVAVAILWGVFKISAAIYRVATTAPAAEEQTPVNVGDDLPGNPAAASIPQPPAGKTSRTPIPVPPLYID